MIDLIMIKSVSHLFRFVAKHSREGLQKFNTDYICFWFDCIIKSNTKRDFDSTILSKIDQNFLNQWKLIA